MPNPLDQPKAHWRDIAKTDWNMTNPRDTGSIQAALLKGIYEELRTPNQLLGCDNFIGIPRTLKTISRNTAKPRRPKVKTQ